MQKILLQSDNLEDAIKMRDFFESRLPYAADISGSKRETEEYLNSLPVHLFIWETAFYGLDAAEWVRDIRALGYIHPILILANTIDVNVMKGSVKNDKIRFLQKPYEYKALKGLTLKLIQSRNLPQQMYKRFKTNQPLAIESYSTGEHIESSMFNLSVGGAYFETEKKPAASVGDLLKMQVNLNDVDKNHMMSARIVWTTKKGSYSGGYGVGVKFVRNEEIYRQLLEKL